MSRFWRISIALAALCVAFAAMAVAASAAKPRGGKDKKATGARLDPSFGRSGLATTAIPRDTYPLRMSLSQSGRVYVLENSLLLAFEADGKPAQGFGNNGRVKVAPTAGVGEPDALAVDSEGRVLVTGTVNLGSQSIPAGQPGSFGNNRVDDAYVIRFLPNGDRDVTFGSGGEIETNFGLPRATGAPGTGIEYEPSVIATSIVVDSQDRPIIGGGYVITMECGIAPFVGRLTSSGAVDASFHGKGDITIAPRVNENANVTALAETPEAGTASLSSGRSCGPRTDETKSEFNAFTESGEQSPGLDPARPSFYMNPTMAVDPKGRTLVIQYSAWFEEEKPNALVRLQSSGAVDTTFGHSGGVPFGGRVIGGALAVDSKSRPILARGTSQIELMRLQANGKIDKGFGNRGIVKAGGGKAVRGVEAVALDSRGRIYTAATVEDPKLKTGLGVQIARFLPGS